MKQCIVLLAMANAAPTAFAQHQPERTGIRFAAETLSVDTLCEDDSPASRTFTFTNTGAEPVSIVFVNTSCGCTTATYTREAVAAGKTGTVTLTFRPKHRPGHVRESATVYTAGNPQTPAAVLRLTGFVTPTHDRWGTYRFRAGYLCLMRKQVVFTGAAVGGKAEARILCANSGGNPLRLSAVRGSLPAWLTMRTEPVPIPANGEADLVLTADATRLPKGRKGDVTASVILDGISCAPSLRTLTITVHPDFK